MNNVPDMRTLLNEAKSFLNEAAEVKAYLLNGNLWLSNSPNNGSTTRLEGRGYVTDKKGDKNFNSGVKAIVKWSQSTKAIKKSKKQSLHKIGEYSSHNTEANDYDIWGGSIKPNKYKYILVSTGKINVVGLFDSKAEALSWIND
jgi:hypothetical protein